MSSINDKRRRDEIECISIGNATDGQLYNELMRRCLNRLEQNLTSTDDEKIKDHLFEVGKLLIRRGLKDTPI